MHKEHSCLKLVSDLFKKNIKETLISAEIVEIRAGEADNIYKVYVNERIAIKYPGKSFIQKEYSWIYTVIFNGDKLGLSDIKKWNKK